jgi:hypothetical protein
MILGQDNIHDTIIRYYPWASYSSIMPIILLDDTVSIMHGIM